MFDVIDVSVAKYRETFRTVVNLAILLFELLIAGASIKSDLLVIGYLILKMPTKQNNSH